MEYWYKVATPRKEVREGRSFNPDEFAIHMEQVVARTAPEDYREPKKFFDRTCFTRALREHAGMVLRRLAGETVNTAPVMTLITQFGGGKTHTLTALYHLVTNGAKASEYSGVGDLLKESGLKAVPAGRVAVFVGNAWDPREGRETPWIDVARQLAGEKGAEELGSAARTTPPGTEALGRIFAAAGAPALLLFDEVLNFMNRHRGMAEQFHAFLQNLTVATTGTTRGAAVISLPRSQVEMTDWDMQWQDRIMKVVRRVAKDLIANDETEISEVVRRRLFEKIGTDRTRKNVAKIYADWCFDHRAELPPDWTAATTEAKSREFLRGRFEVCYPFHPATLSVFQRKWQALPQYQQTRGTLAMLAQWISWAYRTGFTEARPEPLITLGSAPLEVPEFRSVVLGQLGEARLVAAIETDIAGQQSHARTLDTDAKGPLRSIHRRVGTAILFESSGGQVDKVAHLPELRFAVGGPAVDTTSVDNAAFALESKSYYFRRVGTDGFKINHKATLKKVMNDRRASLDLETEIKPAMRKIIDEEYRRGAGVPVVSFPEDGAAVPDTPRLTLVVMDPAHEWTGGTSLRKQIAEWMRLRGESSRLYPASLVWCLKKPGRDLCEGVETWLAWRRVAKELDDQQKKKKGRDKETQESGIEDADPSEVAVQLKLASESTKEEVWGGYRFAVIADPDEAEGVKVIDLGAGHSSSGETLCGRVIAALRSQAILNESVGSGYLERNWPPAFKGAGAWPLESLRRSFLNGSLTRLLDPDTTLRGKIVEFVNRGELGLASGRKADGTYERVWHQELIGAEEVEFDPDVFLLTKATARALKRAETPESAPVFPPPPVPEVRPGPPLELEPAASVTTRTFHISGKVPPELWNRLGTRILPKLRSGTDLQVGVDFSVSVTSDIAKAFEADLRQILDDLGLSDKVQVD
ncbi:MAG: DUF499 domain-containing protein [Acidobacteriota bacterium]